MIHSDSTDYKKNLSTHCLNVSIATKLKSADQALFLHHIAYWIEYNERLERNFHEGRYWTYSTLEDLNAHFPYWTKDQLRTIINKLVEKGVVLKGNYNENKYDRTVWYSIDWTNLESPKSICEISQMELSENPNRNAQNPTPIPHNIPHNNRERVIGERPKNNLNSPRKVKTSRGGGLESDPPPDVEKRDSYGTYVKLTPDEYKKLCDRYGKEKTDEIIESMNDHCINNRPKGYNSYVSAFRGFLKNYKPINNQEYREQNKTQGGTYEFRNQRRANTRKTENKTGTYINGVRVG